MEAFYCGEGLLLAGGWLIVWCFRLDLAHEDILCIYELVLIQRVVLNRCTDARVVNQVSSLWMDARAGTTHAAWDLTAKCFLSGFQYRDPGQRRR